MIKPSVKKKKVSKLQSTDTFEISKNTRKHGTRSIVKSFFSPDSSAISRMRRETDYQSPRNTEMMITDKDWDGQKSAEKQLKINVSAQVWIWWLLV